MKYTIIGSGKIGTALARTFARKNIEVGIANSREEGRRQRVDDSDTKSATGLDRGVKMTNH